MCASVSGFLFLQESVSKKLKPSHMCVGGKSNKNSIFYGSQDVPASQSTSELRSWLFCVFCALKLYALEVILN